MKTVFDKDYIKSLHKRSHPTMKKAQKIIERLRKGEATNKELYKIANTDCNEMKNILFTLKKAYGFEIKSQWKNRAKTINNYYLVYEPTLEEALEYRNKKRTVVDGVVKILSGEIFKYHDKAIRDIILSKDFNEIRRNKYYDLS